MENYLNGGYTYDYFEKYYNPEGFFDEVYCLCPNEKNLRTGKISYINAEPKNFDKIINMIEPDIIRAYDGWNCSDWAIANCVTDIPIVVSVHDTNPNLINQSLKYADFIICMTNAVKDEIKEQLHIEDCKLYVMPNRVDTSMFYKTTDYNIFKKLDTRFGKGKHIIHVGRKAKQKNLDTLIKALVYLPKEYSILFIGPGNIDFYKKLATELNVLERCFFIEHVVNDELPIYYSWADCMCTPSRWEGFGFVFIEAAACECPIVTSNIAPLNEYLVHEQNSFLVDNYEEPQNLAIEIIRACSDDPLLLRIKKNARKTALKFDKTIVDKHEKELYKIFISSGTDNLKVHNLHKEKRQLKKKVILFGAGTIGKRLLNLIETEKVAYFVDTDKSKVGKYIDDIQVIGYEDLLKIYRDYTIIVTPVDRKEIVEQLRQDHIEYMEAHWYLLLYNKLEVTSDTNELYI